ncbi:MAG: ROK family protein [Culicoidibacterales bacterium]
MLVCVDIGGSAIKLAVINQENQLAEKKAVKVIDEIESIYQIITNFAKEMQDNYGAENIQGIAIASPGAVDTKTGIIGGASALQAIHGPNFKADLAQRTGLPIAIENDANCAALAEIYYGAAKDNSDICTMVIGSGVGGTITKDKKIHHGSHLHGGEFGYMLVATQNGVQTLSQVASTAALVRHVQDIKQDMTIDGEQVFELAQKEPPVQAAVEQFYFYLALGAINVQYTYDPEVIVFGGAISQRPDFIQQINQKVSEIMTGEGMVHAITPLCTVSQFYNDANLLGAKVNFLQNNQSKGE